MIKLIKCSGKTLIAYTFTYLLFSIFVPVLALAQRDESGFSSGNEFLADSPILAFENLIEENIAVLALNEGVIYNTGRLIGLDLNTGIPVWEIEKIDWTKASTFYCDTSVIISEGNYSSGYNLKNGEQLWENTTPVYGVSCESQVGFYYESYPPEIFIVDFLSGDIIWFERVRRLKGSIPVHIIDDHYLAVFQNKGFRIYDLRSSMFWEYRSKMKSNREYKSFGYVVQSVKSSESSYNRGVSESMSNLLNYRDEWYYAGNSRIVKFDSNGLEIWSIPLPNNLNGQILLIRNRNRLYYVNRIDDYDLMTEENAFAIGSLDMQSGENKGILFYSESEFLTDIEFKGDSLYIMTSREILLAEISEDLGLLKKNQSLMEHLVGKPVAISKGGYKETLEGFELLPVESIYIEDEFGSRIQMSDSSSYAVVDNHDIFSIKSHSTLATLLTNLKESWIVDPNYRLILEESASNRAIISGCYLLEIEGNSLIYQNICR